MGQLYVLSSWDGDVVFFRLQAHLHHYLQVDGMEECAFAEAVSSLSALIQEYDELDATKSMPVLDVPRLSVALWKKQLNMHCYLLWLTFVFPLCLSHCLWFRKSSLFFSVRKSGSILSKTTASVLLIYTLTKYNKNNIYFIHTPVCGVTCSNLSKLREPDVAHHVIQCVWHAGGLCVQDQPGLCSESQWRGKEWFFIFFPSHSFLLQTVNTSGRTVRTFSVFTLYLFVLFKCWKSRS